MSKFPKFESHDKASCCHCGRGLGGANWLATEYPPGHGQYVQRCEKCRMATWYDLKQSEAA